jgi:two-component system, cell cycle sensor histidine kinase and response regulator CckA
MTDGLWRNVFDAAPVAVVLLDLSGRILDVNAAAEALLGARRDDLIGVAFDGLAAIQDRDDVAAQLSKLVMGTVPVVHLEGIRMGGGGMTAMLRGARIGSEEEARVAVYLLAAADPRVDPELLQGQKLQALGQLAGGVAHDFNNLLTAILGFTDLLLARPVGEADRADLEQVRRNARRGSRLVGQLLAFSRRQPTQPVTLSVNAALRDLTKMLDRLLGETVELTLDLAADPARIRIDAGHFDQMIINLAVNARDAMPGGGQLTITTRDEADAHVRIDVADTGVGIPKEILSDIFDPFFTTKGPGTGGGGTGLGLSTVYGIVRQAGGSVEVDSAPGRGCRFIVRLPAADADARLPAADAGARLELEPPPAAVARPPTAGATVLLVEDEDAVRQFAARALTARGHTVLEAESGEIALDLLGDLSAGGTGEAGGRALDLLVSDVVMPGVDGYTLSRLAREERPDLRVVLMSGYADDALAPGLADDPGIRFLAKPFTLADLADTVAAALADR